MVVVDREIPYSLVSSCRVVKCDFSVVECATAAHLVVSTNTTWYTNRVARFGHILPRPLRYLPTKERSMSAIGPCRVAMRHVPRFRRKSNERKRARDGGADTDVEV